MTTLPSRLSIAHLPTPLEPLPRLATEFGIPFHVKRDDLTGSHLSGNKLRKLDYLLADALSQGATHVLTCGGMQSNHARATALAARPLGLHPVLLLRTPNGHTDDLPSPPNGNILLDLLAGATLHTCTPAAYRQQRSALLASLADDIRSAGGIPYIVPEGGSNALGSLGYLQCAREIARQHRDETGDAPDLVVTATGSGGTLAGLAIGFEAAGERTRVIGVAVCDDAPYFEHIVRHIAKDAETRFGTPALRPDRFAVLEGFQGEGYAKSTPSEVAFLASTLREHGLALDPVYTNKAMLGLLSTLRADPGSLTADGEPPRSVVFVHTGGLFGVFGHAFTPDELARL
jgi:D-cysteine desulfhydrase